MTKFRWAKHFALCFVTSVMQQCQPPVASLDAFLTDPGVAAEVYFPRKVRNEPPPGAVDYNIPVNDKDGISLGARWYRNDPTRPTVLVFHGNGETVPDYNFVARGFAEHARLNVFVVDYRGYGWSSGEPTLQSLLADARPVVRFFLEKLSEVANAPRPILFGRSLGSAPAAEIAASELANHFDALILDSGFSDVRLLLQLFRIDAGDFEDDLIQMFSNKSKLATTKLPTMVIHGEKDHLIPAEHAHENFESVPEANGRQLLLIPDAGHNDLMLRADLYFGGIDRFLRKL